METLEQFSKRMETVEFRETLVVGPSHQGNTRSIIDFENITCTLEERGYRNIPDRQTQPATPAQMLYIATAEPFEFWECFGYEIVGKKRAKTIAKHYNATPCEYPYQNENGGRNYLSFKTFEQLMAFIYDLKTGEFEKKFGKEPVSA